MRTHRYGRSYGMGAMRLGWGRSTVGRMNEVHVLRDRLRRATVRRENSVAFSPEWQAAMGEIDDLTAGLARLAIRARTEAAVPAAV